MNRLTAGDHSQVREFLSTLYAPRSPDAFTAHVLRSLQRVVSADILGYSEIDWERPRALFVTRPGDARFPGSEEAFQRYLDQHPCLAHRRRTGEGRALKLSDFLAPSQLHRLELYQELYRPLGIEHVISIALWTRAPVTAGIALCRGAPDFSEGDRAVLDLLRVHLAHARAGAEAVTRLGEELALLREGHADAACGAALLTRDGQPRLVTESARRWLWRHLGEEPGPRPWLPDLVQRWVLRQLDLEEGAELPPPREPLVVENDRSRLVVRLLSQPDGHLLVLEESPRWVDAAARELFRLGKREGEILSLLVEGKTNPEIGARLNLSPRTIQKHLERVFKKLGVRTRTAAAVRVARWRN
jgi:DNA-binding CsgD family transcriptional regulator